MKIIFFEVKNLLKGLRISRHTLPLLGHLKPLSLLFIVTFSITLLLILLETIILEAFSIDRPATRIISSDQSKDLFYLLPKYGILFPIVEEMEHRVCLIYSKLNFSLMIVFLLLSWTPFYYFFGVENYALNLTTKFLICSFIGLFVYSLLSKRKNIDNALTQFWDKHHTIIFYISFVLFGFGHIVNYNLSLSAFLLMPLITLHQSVAGIFLGYTRLKYGIISSILLHGMLNATPILISHFSK